MHSSSLQPEFTDCVAKRLSEESVIRLCQHSSRIARFPFIDRGNRHVGANGEKASSQRSATQTAGGAKGLASHRLFAL